MTKKKQQLTEELDGIGELAGLVLIRKPESASGYYGVRPAGKKWQARVYKPDKLPKAGWDPIDTFHTVREAAIAAATARRDVESGAAVLSPERRRLRKTKGRHTPRHTRHTTLHMLCLWVRVE